MHRLKGEMRKLTQDMCAAFYFLTEQIIIMSLGHFHCFNYFLFDRRDTSIREPKLKYIIIFSYFHSSFLRHLFMIFNDISLFQKTPHIDISLDGRLHTQKGNL